MAHSDHDGHTLAGAIRILSGAAEVSAQATLRFVDGSCREAVYREPGTEFAGALTSVRFTGEGADLQVDVSRQGALESSARFARGGSTEGHYRLAQGLLTFTVVTQRLSVLQEAGGLEVMIDALIHFDEHTESHLHTRILLSWVDSAG